MEQKQNSLNVFLDYMTRKGLNITSQRKTIAEAFFELPGHHSLEEFYQHILGRDSGIGQTTVYRTLKLLCDAHLANEIQFSDNITRYESVTPGNHHDHMICLDCGAIIEICDSRIENLQKEIAAQNNFLLLGHAHNLYGYCAKCAPKHAQAAL